MRTLFVILLVSLVSFGATAQTTTTQTQPAVQKIGYAEWDYIFSQLPEFKQIDNDLNAWRSAPGPVAGKIQGI